MNQDLRKRTFEFSLNIIEITELLPKCKITDVIIYQLVKCGTSVGANYRAAKRARSDREFISKINIVLEETDETLFLLEIIKVKKWLQDETIEKMLKEANELTSIFVSTLKTMNSKIRT